MCLWAFIRRIERSGIEEIDVERAGGSASASGQAGYGELVKVAAATVLLNAATNCQARLRPEDVGITHGMRDYARLHGMVYVGILADTGRNCGGSGQASLNQSRCELQ